MKKILLVAAIFLLALIISLGAMLAFKVCPPRGPWPTPPWCKMNFTVYEYSLNTTPSKLPQIKAVNMYDTWGRNYNMGMFETTQANIDSSFDRVQKLGANEVFVHDFDRAVYEGDYSEQSTNYKLVDETFWNDMRDESISATDLNSLVASAHARGLKFGIKRNLAFVNIGKYITSGLSGNIAVDVANDYQKFNRSHSEAWIRDYFVKWQNRLVEKGKLYQAAGVDIMSVSPTFQSPTFVGHEELANTLWKNLIAAVRTSFQGQILVDWDIYGLTDGVNGQEDWKKYDYYKDADIVEARVYKILERYQDKDHANMKQDIANMVVGIDDHAKALGIKISLFYAPSSYQNGIWEGPVEFLDVKNDKIKNLVKDYDEQVNAYSYFFEAVKDKNNIARLNVGNFTWDDALDPEVRARVSVSASFRNKPAEQLIEAWFTKK